MKSHLRLVPNAKRPLIHLSRAEQMMRQQNMTGAEKLDAAKAWLRERERYILDRGTPAPKWGKPHEVPPAPNEAMLERETNADRRRKL